MKRRHVKQDHERSVVDSFRQFLEGSGRELKVLSYPDPPDAVVVLDRHLTWIEITDAFINGDFAKLVTAYAADDVGHGPEKQQLLQEPGPAFVEVVASVITEKYTKSSIAKIYHTSGPGILLVGLFSPSLTPDDIVQLVDFVAELRSRQDHRFQEIYLYNQQHQFYRVP